MVRYMLKRTLPELGSVIYLIILQEDDMKLNDVKRNPCSKCPYTLGLIHSAANPCPQCKLNGYQSYKWFRRQLSGEAQKK